MILFDTRDLPAADRVEAFHAAATGMTVPFRIVHEDPDGDVHARMDRWDFGRSSLFGTHASGFRLIRTPRHIRMGSLPIVALVMQTQGRGLFETQGHRQVVGAHDLVLNDLTTPYEFAWSGDGTSRAFMVEYDQLALPADVVREASRDLRASPLYGLVRHHFGTLARDAERLSLDAGADGLAAAASNCCGRSSSPPPGTTDIRGP
ncbi:hypothetical protein ACFQX6_04775 [Streptosporangium lutulentum]